MSLVLNGGVNGSASTQYGYAASTPLAGFPVTLACWFRCGTNASATGVTLRVVDSAATVGLSNMGHGLSRSVGPALSQQMTIRSTTETATSVQTRDEYAYAVAGITTGATTTIAADFPSGNPYAAGEWVRPVGTFTGITGLTSGNVYRVSSVGAGALTIEAATSGSWGEGLSATVRWAAWQPERWNLAVVVLDPAQPRRQLFGGFQPTAGASVVSLSSSQASFTVPDGYFATLNRICLGALVQATVSSHFRGELARVAAWSGFKATESQAAELLTLAPDAVSWATPSVYWPLTSDGNDSIGSNHLTLVGSPDVTADGPTLTGGGGGGGGGLGYLHSMRSRNPSIFGVR